MTTFVRLEDRPDYQPPGHDHVLNRLLVGRELGTDALSVWHGRFEPDGASDVHVHETSIQVYVGLAGDFAVSVGEEQHVLVPMAVVTIPAGVPHDIRNSGSGEAEVLVISTPALR